MDAEKQLRAEVYELNAKLVEGKIDRSEYEAGIAAAYEKYRLSQ